MGKTAFSGPVLGNADSLGGAGINLPIEIINLSDNWSVYFNDFNKKSDYSTDDFTVTQVGATGTVTVELDALRLDVTTDDDGAQVQLDGSVATGLAPIGHTPTAAVADTSAAAQTVFGARFKIMDVSASGIFVGLAELISGGSGILADSSSSVTSDTHVGFSQQDSDNGAIIFSAAGDDDTAADEVNGTDVMSTPLLDGIWVEVAIRMTGAAQYEAWVKTQASTTLKYNKIASGTIADSNWDKQLLPTFACLGAATTDDLWIDYVFVASKRNLLI
jgi:hypothetical protein